MVKPCKVTYGGKEYSIEEYLGILHDGLLDQLVNDGVIDDSNFVQPLKPIEKTEDDISREQTQETEILLNGLADKRRKDGKFVRDGVEYVRNEKGLGELSDKKGEVRFTNEISIPFRYKLVEANTLQPSHQDGIRNSFHFIPEAQPKNRNDKGSLQAEESFANNPRFNELGESTNAYSGAPVVNERNEVIQGNNRSAGLRKGYSRGNEEYKNSLIKNASKFGFTEEQVSSMESPILVRQVAVSDEGAIEIGNYDVKDLETGGIRRLDPVAITRRMPFSAKGRMAELMFSGDETLNQTIRDNQKKIIEIISPYINQAQRNTIIKDGVLSDVGIKDIEDIAKQFLFDNGSSFLPEIFENLSATQKEGLKRSLPYIFSVPPEKGLVQDIQVAIIAINDFNSSGAGSFNGWLSQADMFNEGLTPKDKYSPLEIAIAKLLVEEKTQKGISSVFSEYARAVTDKPADMFEPAKEGKSRAEGVLEIFKVEDNERPSNTTSGEDVGSEQKDKAKEKAEPSERKTISIRTPPAIQKKEPEVKIKALSEIDAFKAKVKEAKDNLDKLNKNLGIASDPEQKARALFEYHKALVGLAKAYIKAGVNSVKDFAKEIGESVTQEVKDAWNEANGKGKKTLSDFKEEAEKLQAKEEKERLSGKAKRMTPQRLLASDEYRDEFKQAIGEDTIYYSVLPNRITEQEAQAIIDLKGNENAEIAIMDMNNGIKMAVRNKIAQKLIDNYEEEGNIEKAVDIFAKITEKITDSAQGLQSLSLWPKLSPASAVYMAKQSIKKQRDKRAANSKNTTDKIDKEFKNVNKDSIKEALDNIKNIVEKNSLPNAGVTITELPSGYGQNNKVFTREKYLAAKKSLRGYTLSFAGGVPMEKFIDIAGYHIEATGKDFNKFTRRMKADLGNKIKPYLKDIYAKTRKKLIDSGYDTDLFLSDEEVDTQILEQEGKVFEEKLKKAIDKKDEKAQKVAIAKLQEISKEDGLWGQYKQSAANRLKNVVVTNIQKDISENPSLEQFTDSLVKNMRLKMAELLPEVTKKKAVQRPDIEVIGDAFKNFEKYKDVWEQTQIEFQEKYQEFPEILEAIDAYFGEILDKPFSDKLLTRSINKGLKEMGVVINDIVTKHYTVVDNTKQTLVDKLINDAGLTGAESQTLAKAIEKEFDRIATEKKSKILAKIFSRRERKKPEVRSMESDIIRMTNLGAFRSDDLVKIYGDKMGWPTLTEANIKEIERLATIVQKTEDPIKKRKAVEDLLAYQANIKGVSVLDVATAIWYANILSGYNTQFVNFGSNAINTALLYGNVIAQNPRDAKFITKGLINGIKRGLLEGKEVLRTGYSPIKGKAEIPSLLERANFKDAIKGLPLPFVKALDYASKLKYVRRIMVAADVIFFEGLKEMRAYQIAAQQAANEGKEKPTMNQLNRAIELVGASDWQYQAAREKAQLEYDREVDDINSKGLPEKKKKAALNQAEIDRRRRIYDLIEQNRSSNIIDESAEYAAEGTYNYPPKGGLGLAANALNTMVSGVPVLRYAIPFTNILANTANETINYTPLAFARLKKGGFTNFRREALTQPQRTDLLYKGIIGTTLMAATFALTQIKGDDDEPILEITANGTGDYVKNATLQETGWQPYSIRFKLPNGEYSGWFSYQYSPLIAALGYIGNINDMMKYGDADDETIISLMSKSAGMTTSTFFQNTFLDGLGDLLSTVLDSRNIQKQQSIVEKLLGAGAGAVKALLIANLFNQTSQAVQKITGEYKKETTKNVTGKFLQDIPYARDMFFDKINILGDPISPDTDKFLSFGKPNKAIELLVKNKQVFGPISREGEKIYDIVKDKERALTDEEFFEYSKEKGQFIKNALLKDYDKFSKMTPFEFGKELTEIKKKATESARYEISDMGSDLSEIVRYIDGEPKTFKLAPENVAQAVNIASKYKNTPEMIDLKKQQVEAYVKVGKLSKQEAEKKASMQINKNAIKYAKNMIWLKHTKAEKPQDVLAPN